MEGARMAREGYEAAGGLGTFWAGRDFQGRTNLRCMTKSGARRSEPAEGGAEGAGNGMIFAERGVRTTSGAAVGLDATGCGWTKGW